MQNNTVTRPYLPNVYTEVVLASVFIFVYTEVVLVLFNNMEKNSDSLRKNNAGNCDCIKLASLLANSWQICHVKTTNNTVYTDKWYLAC